MKFLVTKALTYRGHDRSGCTVVKRLFLATTTTTVVSELYFWAAITRLEVVASLDQQVFVARSVQILDRNMRCC